MSRKLVATIVGLVLVLAPTVFADYYIPSPICSKPIKPYKFNSEWEYNNYMNQVRAYQECLNIFIEEQYDAASRHMEAAENAVEEWNRFAREQLN